MDRRSFLRIGTIGLVGLINEGCSQRDNYPISHTSSEFDYNTETIFNETLRIKEMDINPESKEKLIQDLYKKARNSVRLSRIESHERNLLEGVNKKSVKKDIENALGEDIVKSLEPHVNFNDLSDEDYVFVLRVVSPMYGEKISKEISKEY